MLMDAGVGVYKFWGLNKLGNAALMLLNRFIKANEFCKYLRGAINMCLFAWNVFHGAG